MSYDAIARFIHLFLWSHHLASLFMSVIPQGITLRRLQGHSGRPILAEFLLRYNAYFVDYSTVPLLVQQNYLDVIKCVLQPLVAHP